MPTPKNNPEILQEWKEIFFESIAKGIKKYKAYHSIGEAYGVSYATVRYYLDLSHRARDLDAAHRRYRKRRQRRTLLRRYNRNYQRLRRHPERFIGRIFEQTEQASAEDISALLPDFTEGVHFRATTIHRLLEKYVNKARGPPFLEQPEIGVYRISQPL